MLTNANYSPHGSSMGLPTSALALNLQPSLSDVNRIRHWIMEQRGQGQKRIGIENKF